MVELALYCGRGQLGNALIRWWTGSIYSHCELVVDGLCYSSSVMDGGVRCKQIDLDPAKWHRIALPFADGEAIRRYFAETDAYRYGWWGLVASQVFNRNRPEHRAPFCSEWCANALGLPVAASYNPVSLGMLVEWLVPRVRA